MAKKDPVTIKKYANRRLYNTGTSTYVTLEDLASMVKAGDDFLVYDAKTGDDITRSVLTQIIFEQENKDGQNLLPVSFLRQLIRFYGDSMQLLVPRYLELSIDTLSREQDKLRNQLSSALGVNPLVAPFEQHIRRNMDLFEKAFAMFSPFARREDGEPVTDAKPAGEHPVPAAPAAAPAAGDLDELKNQLAAMQKKIDSLSRK
ncbi:polyhydroxyalkanoate synthesis repressor PhaR [Phreatobacter oligotrophus]|jgi:polyhydroxyalkanoate synthesis repressor PhaR|uniref:polyhydroxyalkanoate synthesis repressor PhaR n=1 Tax=Phreatobacter oligotrophus TaxID=1122261 RepID=UPI0023548FFA|nr:polyhydroxyalkanoate synthesis repressor PhaR [Phreatobacter oligotrophus]MBX9989406.1 polyhydroxyalkanoate synthesis repressor PhaR [Phreatobacter oligotrophus]